MPKLSDLRRQHLRHQSEHDQNLAAMREWFESLTPQQRRTWIDLVSELAKLAGQELTQAVAKLPVSTQETILCLAAIAFSGIVLRHSAARLAAALALVTPPDPRAN